ncbi:Ring finger domain [seawater metagenome]|uniref:Ring finger domain n=1 Tax=seawater metagenome TaxID=1561972 RepID=A0A5E8CMD1_9ZZZZ
MELNQIADLLKDIHNMIDNNYLIGNEEIIIDIKDPSIFKNNNFIKNLGPYKQIKKDDELLKNDIKCSICCQNFKEGEYKRNLPLCNHVFHKKCIDKWLKNKKECPICRCDYSCLE